MLKNPKSFKITTNHIRSFIYRKHLEILTIISLIAFLSVLFSSQIFQTFSNITPKNFKTNITKSSSAVIVTEIPKFITTTQSPTTTESPYQIKLKKLLNCKNKLLYKEKLQYSDYWLMKNYITGLQSYQIGCAESITYTTHGDFTFISHLPKVVKRWLAPVSFALYAPGDDYKATMDSIQYVRNCLPESELIRDYVTFHIYFPREHLPQYIAKSEMEALQWPYNCSLPEAPYENVNRLEMYKTLKNLTYPINVGRNIARKSANTYFVFACDIELYPNYDLVGKFLDMMVEHPELISKPHKRKVYVMPVFEVDINATIPNDKDELKQMLNDSTAVPFHVNVCSSCHLVPKQKEWLAANNTEKMQIFTVGKRKGAFASWEPFYISDNKEPIFDERVTWEGQSNKRIQNYAMCLLGYEYHILHPAFLVHAPGIKKLNTKSQEFQIRSKYVDEMNKIISEQIMSEYMILYGKDKWCKI